jgi:hypothetical protein
LKGRVTMYDHNTYINFIYNGKVKEAVAYLIKWDKTEEANQIKTRFIDIQKPTQYSNFINDILICYYNYYKDVFWDQIESKDAVTHLVQNLGHVLHIAGDINELEEIIENKFKEEGYYFLGGETGNFYGPYIWKTMEPQEYQVEILNQTHTTTVNFMDGFISLSWLDYLSAGETGTGGWVTGGGEELYCVKSKYIGKLDTPQFKISYLKHETQHFADKKIYGKDGVSSKDLEYRAKLVELMYYPDLSLLLKMISRADGSDKRYTHSYAEYVIVNQLSKRIFNEEFVIDQNHWTDKLKDVQEVSKNLFSENTHSMNLATDKPIDII